MIFFSEFNRTAKRVDEPKRTLTPEDLRSKFTQAKYITEMGNCEIAKGYKACALVFGFWSLALSLLHLPDSIMAQIGACIRPNR